MAEKYVVFDFETTGLSPQKNEIIQIGAVKFDENDKEIARFNQLVRPQHSVLSDAISELTQIFSQELIDKPIIEEVLPDFLNFIQGNLLVAHNAPFDISFLYQAIIDSDIRGVENFKIYDTLSESKHFLRRRSYKLESFKELLNLNLRSHDALNDCLITAALYQHLQNLEKEKQAKKAKTRLSLSDGEQLDLFADFDEHLSDEITAEVRRALGLPITRDLVYYQKAETQIWQKHLINALQINHEYSTGYRVTITLDNAEQIVMHSDFLKEMQKPNFTNEMEHSIE